MVGPGFALLQPPLQEESYVAETGFLTGNCNLKGHLHKLGIRDDAFCRFCGDEG